MFGKSGFGIVEVLIAAVVLGFLYLALLHMQVGNREALLRVRGRDGAVEVAQYIIDSLKTVGVASVGDFERDDIKKSWGRGPGGEASINYKATVKVTDTETSETNSLYENSNHVYAKQIDVTVSWRFKSTDLSIDVSSVVR